MTKTQKAKNTKGERNDARKNGKASKNPLTPRGSRRTPLTEGQKVVLGGGLLKKWDRFNHDEKLKMKAKDRRKPKDD